MKIFGGEANLHASVYGSLISKFILYLMSRIQEILHKSSCQRLWGEWGTYPVLLFLQRIALRSPPIEFAPLSSPPPYAVFAPTLCRVRPHFMPCSPPPYAVFAPTLCRVRPHTFRVRPHQVEFTPWLSDIQMSWFVLGNWVDGIN